MLIIHMRFLKMLNPFPRVKHEFVSSLISLYVLSSVVSYEIPSPYNYTLLSASDNADIILSIIYLKRAKLLSIKQDLLISIEPLCIKS